MLHISRTQGHMAGIQRIIRPAEGTCRKEFMQGRAHPLGNIREFELREVRLELRLELLQQRPRVQSHESVTQELVHAIHVAGMRPERVMDARECQACREA